MQPAGVRACLALASLALITLASGSGCAPPEPAKLPDLPPPTARIPERSEVPEAPEANESGRAARIGLSACDRGRVDVDFFRLRAWKRASWIARMFEAEPRFGELAVPGEVAPFEDATRVRLCVSQAFARAGAADAVVLRHTVAEPHLRAALAAYARRVDQGGAEDLGEPRVRATRIRVGTDVWTAIEAQGRGGELLFAPPEVAKASAARYLDMPALPGLRGDASTGFEAFFAAPDDLFALPSALRGLHDVELALRLLPDGAAELGATARAESPAEAERIAKELEAFVDERSRSFVVKMVLRGLLSSFTVTSSGAEVRVKLPATGPQMDAVLSLVAAELGALRDALRAHLGPRVSPSSRAPSRPSPTLSRNAQSVVKDAP